VRVYRVQQATNEIVRLDGKHRSLWESITQFERLLSNGQTHGHMPYSNLKLRRDGSPASVWKGRVIYPPLGGKRSGLRYVYERVEIGNDEYAVALTVYVHQEGNKESDAIDRIRKRSQSFEATMQGLRALDGSDTDMLLQ